MSIRPDTIPFAEAPRPAAALSDIERRVGLVDAPAPAELSTMTALLAESVGVPVALVSIVQTDRDRQYFAAAVGLSEPWATRRQTPLSHSFCRHVAASGAPLIVEDAREAPLVRDNLAIDALGVIAYLGVPIHWTDGTPIGALCAIDSVPRRWTEADRTRLTAVAQCVDGFIRMLHVLHDREVAAAEINLARVSQTLFYSGLQHELRTPLNGVLGMAEVLAQTALDDDQSLYLSVLTESATQILDMAERMGSATETFVPGRLGDAAVFDLRATLDEIASVLRHQLPGVRVHVRVQDGFAPLRRGDRTRLRHILYEVLRQALVAAMGGWVMVSIAAADDGMVNLSVIACPDTDWADAPRPAATNDFAFAERLLAAVGGTLSRPPAGTATLAIDLRLPLPEADG